MFGHDALYWVFWGMGMTAHQARHCSKEIGRLRLCNWSSDDWAAMMLKWRTKETERMRDSYRQQLWSLTGYKGESPSQHHLQELVGDKEEDGWSQPHPLPPPHL